MIRIRLSVKSAMISSLDAEGHANSGPKGNDIVCSSVSILLRSVCNSLETLQGAELSGSAEKEGDLHLRVKSVPEEYGGELKGITRVLVLGLRGLQKDFPDHLTLEVVGEE